MTAQEFCQDAERNLEIRQHLGWLKMYLATMSKENWQDMRDYSTRQIQELEAAISPDREAR